MTVIMANEFLDLEPDILLKYLTGSVSWRSYVNVRQLLIHYFTDRAQARGT